MRKSLVAGNWKMNLTVSEAVDFSRELVRRFAHADISDRDIVIAPNFTALFPVSEILRGSPIKLAAQNLFWEEKGAYTGETSASMLKSAGAEYVIIGHSERRKYFGETDETVAKRIRAALSAGLASIFCVGETLEERNADRARAVVETQLSGGLEGIDHDGIGAAVIAYEPVWAIGTGMNATPDQAGEMHRFIRDFIEKRYDKTIAKNIKILYGGSVTAENIDTLLGMPDIDGALVGGASLKADSFEHIVKFRRE